MKQTFYFNKLPEKNQERAVWLPQLMKHRIKLPLYFFKKNPSYLK